MPKYASNIVSRAQKAECNTYLELAKQCGQDKTPQQLAQFAASKRQEFEQVRMLGAIADPARLPWVEGGSSLDMLVRVLAGRQKWQGTSFFVKSGWWLHMDLEPMCFKGSCGQGRPGEGLTVGGGTVLCCRTATRAL